MFEGLLHNAKPGGVVQLPAGTHEGNLVLPRGYGGLPGKPITIRGGRNTVIRATDPTKAAIVGGGCKHLVIEKLGTLGGLNGIQFSQNGSGYTEDGMILDITVRNVKVRGPVDDGVKFNGGRNIILRDSDVEGGKDQGVDFLGIEDGLIANNDIAAKWTGIVLKGGTRRVRVINNRIAALDGISLSDKTAPQWQAPWTANGCEGCLVQGNSVRASGRPIVLCPGMVDCEYDDNDLVTTKLVGGLPAGLIIDRRLG